MIKNHGSKKLSKTGSHRKAMFANMMSSLIMSEKVVTTFPKAKELRRFFDMAVNKLQKKDYARVRQMIRNKEAFKKLTEVLNPRFKDKKSGFTSVIKIGERKGDASMMALVKLVD
jgi:large subunit ribosomal protein L17